MQTVSNLLNQISKLKIARRIISVLLFILTCLSIWFILPQKVVHHLLSFQLGLAILRLSDGLVKSSLAGILILVLVFVVLGRVYCSILCPLGFLQDVAIWAGRILRIKHEWKIGKKKQLKILRISVLTITVVLLFIGSAFLSGLLDPFSIFSRFMFVLKMIALGTVKGYFLPILFVSATICVIVLLAAKKGRIFCSWLCPVGTMFWGLSKVSLFKFKINQSACNQCGKCVVSCKSGAISEDTQIIDQALCIGCFNCLSVCNQKAIKLAPERYGTKNVKYISENEKAGRRNFLHQFSSVLFVMGSPLTVNVLNGILSGKEQLLPVFPLGSMNLARFKSKCTGCMVCSQACPSGIIKPSMGSFIESPVVPVLDFQKNYCLEDCVTCSQICPTGALHEVRSEEKQNIKMASLELNLSICQIVADGLECAICAEICPLHALEMKQVPDQKFPVPVVIQEKCNGCGKCQYRCPVKNREDIFIFSS